MESSRRSFKYEPAHTREDIARAKLPVVSWGGDGVAKDIVRIRQFVEVGAADLGYAIVIDEGGAFRQRSPHSGGVWLDWQVSEGPPWLRPSLHVARFPPVP